jgi:hypothetical protein
MTIEIIEERLIKVEEKVELISSAFPGGDFSGHSRYHEAIIRDLNDRRDMRKAILEQVIKGSVWALLVGLATAAWTFVKDHLR